MNELVKHRCMCDYWAKGGGAVAKYPIKEISPGDGMCLLTGDIVAHHKVDIQASMLSETNLNEYVAVWILLGIMEQHGMLE